jgi:hypothetical protein
VKHSSIGAHIVNDSGRTNASSKAVLHHRHPLIGFSSESGTIVVVLFDTTSKGVDWFGFGNL